MQATPIVELLSGVYRFLPNTLTASLIILGIFLGKIAWILIGLGAVALSILVSLLQYGKVKSIGTYGTLSGAAAVSACSVVPSTSESFETVPSLWMATALFYMTYIMKNALVVYSAKPMGTTSDSLTVQHRKGVGIVSIITTVILLAFLIIPRAFWSKCESTLGGLIGGILGIGFGVMWWYILNACGADVYPDIHGVMIGIRPGRLADPL
jgi:hypothetical protein